MAVEMASVRDLSRQTATRPLGCGASTLSRTNTLRDNSAMKREAYAAARTVSPKVQAYFAHHHAEAMRRGQEHLASLPDAETIEAVIDAAFWASLRREEGYVPRISLALLSPEQAMHPLMFERPLPLDPGALTRVALAVERPGIHLGVWRDQNGLCVWGTTRTIPTLSFVLEVTAPGLLVIKHHRDRKSTRLNSSHLVISYAVFCLKKKN